MPQADELAARMGGLADGFVNLEIGVGLVDGLLLVLPYGEGFGPGGHAEDALFEAVPVDIVVFEVDKVQTGYRRILIADGLLGRGVPFVRCRDPQPLHESRHAGFGLEAFARGREECIHVGLVDEGIGRVAFALDGPIFALDGAGHKVDAGVLTAELVMEGKLRPEPDLLEKVGIQGRGFQVSLHEAFETVSFVALGKGVLAEFIQKLGECAHRARLYIL